MEAEENKHNRAWIDASHPMANTELWGLTLLERNLRELDRLGVREVVILTAADNDPLAQFLHPAPPALKLQIDSESGNARDSLAAALANSDAGMLVLDGNAVNDRRILTRMVESTAPCWAISPVGAKPATVALLAKEHARAIAAAPADAGLPQLLGGLGATNLNKIDLNTFDPYVKQLRRTISPFLISVENEAHLRTADDFLRQTVHKGTNDLVAKTIHPPLEFGITRVLARTPITPNHVTFLGIFISMATVYLFATGNLLAGVLLAATKGVLDGVDGKLARLLLKFSKSGDMLDHVGDTIFDALWYLALGWHFSQGDFASTAAVFTQILFFSYWVERIVPGLFNKLHGYEIYDYAAIDRFMRLIGSRMNNNVWVLLVGILTGVARETFYFVSIWMLATAVWHTFRLVFVTWQARKAQPA